MKRKALITIGSDGVVDYVQTPDGHKYMLGPVSVLKLVSSLVPSRTAKRALDEFLQDNKTMVKVDLDKMWGLLPFRRARYSSNNSLMDSGDESKSTGTQMKKASYDTLTNNLDAAEDIIQRLNETKATIDRLVEAGKTFDSVRAKSDLHKIASRLTDIAQNVDMAQPWVIGDLEVLAEKANEIHGMFHSKG